MTNLITLTIPNDDHVALRAFGKALEEMALAHGAEPQAETLVRQRAGDLEVEYLTRNAVAAKVGVTMEELDSVMQVDTTTQQVESLATRQEPLGDEIESIVKENLDDLYVEAAPTTDNSGTPWDERIHSASKALNSDGTWRLRRKPKDMDEMEWSDYVTMIKADLQYPVECGGEQPTLEEAVDAGGNSSENEENTNEINDITPAEIEPPVTREEVDALIEASNEMLANIEPSVIPPGDDFHTDTGVVTEQTVAGIPPIPVPPPLVVPPVTDWDFPKLMKFLTERHGKIDVPTVNQLLAVDGLAALTDLNAHPDKIGPFVARVKAHLGE